MSNDHNKDMTSYGYGAAGSSDGSFYGELGRQKYELEQNQKKQKELEQRKSLNTKSVTTTPTEPTSFKAKLVTSIWIILGLLCVMYVISENTDSYSIKAEHVGYMAGAVLVIKLLKEILLGVVVLAGLYYLASLFIQ